MEAAVCGVRAIAVSFAIFRGQEWTEGGEARAVTEACEVSVRIVDKLSQEWDGQGTAAPDLYTVNVPLVPGVGSKPAKWTWMLANKWRGQPGGGLYDAVPPDVGEPLARKRAGREEGKAQRLCSSGNLRSMRSGNPWRSLGLGMTPRW
ncbi:hypothetical protein MRB53_040239 [Persea americana]|nr:hypothetical protein MRB53_040239 [Persea americana]